MRFCPLGAADKCVPQSKQEGLLLGKLGDGKQTSDWLFVLQKRRQDGRAERLLKKVRAAIS